MIKFTDVCKAYIRYWFIILICIALVLSVVLIVVPKDNSYTAINTLSVDRASGNSSGVSQSEADTIIKEMNVIMHNTNFYINTYNILERDYPDIAKKYDIKKLRDNTLIETTKSSTFFTIHFTSNDKDEAKVIVKVLSKQAIAEHDARYASRTNLSSLYAIDITSEPSKVAIYCVIAILIGLVLGIVIVTFFVVFNPLVENEDLLEKETETPVLASLKKDGSTDVSNLATNIDLMLNNDNEKFLAVTSDTNKYDVINIVNSIVSKYADNYSIAVLSYGDVNAKIDGVNYISINAKKDTADSIKEQTKDNDIVLVICPSMVISKYYLHMSEFVNDIVFVAKKWASRTADIKAMKDIATSENMNVLGIIYQN